jgi:transcriptional regulator with XRE-family HTH domain
MNKSGDGEDGFYLVERGRDSVYKFKKDGSPMPSATFNGATSPWQIVVDAGRLEKQLSISDLATLLKYTKHRLWRYLRSKNGIPRESGIDIQAEHEKICRILDIPLKTLNAAYAATLAGEGIKFRVDDTLELFQVLDLIESHPVELISHQWLSEAIRDHSLSAPLKPQTLKPIPSLPQWRAKTVKYELNDRYSVFHPWTPFQIAVSEAVESTHGSASEFCREFGITLKRYITWTQNSLGYPHPKSFDPEIMVPKLSQALNIDPSWLHECLIASRKGPTLGPGETEFESRLALLWQIRHFSSRKADHAAKTSLIHLCRWIASTATE